MNTASKCKKCEKTAYPMEALTYDGQTYHKACFTCLECGSRVSLSGVAMIQGDLYCKNCFVQKFKVKGTYHIFGTHTMPKGLKPADDATSPKSASPRAPSTPGLKKFHRHTQSAAPPSTSVNSSESKVNAPDAVEEESDPDATTLAELLLHIQHKSVPDVKRMLKYHGPTICLQEIDGKTLVQLAFEEQSIACAQTLLSELSSYVSTLESQIKPDAASPAATPAAATPAAADPSPAPAAAPEPAAAAAE